MRGAAVPAPLRAYPFERGCDESRASPWNGRQAQLSSGIPALIAGNSAALTLIVGDQARIEQPVCATRYSSPAQPGEERGQSLRSEEHTSELQSLMRISYAVFCLKQKKHE